MPKIDKSKMKCNSPKRQVSGGKKFVVKACDKGKEKIVRFGDANMKIRKSNPKARASFRNSASWGESLKSILHISWLGAPAVTRSLDVRVRCPLRA